METSKKDYNTTGDNSKLQAISHPIEVTKFSKKSKLKNYLKKIIASAERRRLISPKFRLAIIQLPMKLKATKKIENETKHIEIESAEKHLQLAHKYLEHGDLKQATQSATSAVTLAPSYAEAYHTLAECLFVNGQQDEAIFMLNKTIALAPHYIEAYFTRGYIFYTMKQLRDAEASLQTALQLHPSYVEALNYLGRVRQDAGHMISAEEMYRKAIALRPDYTDAHNNLGFLLRHLDRLDEATECFRFAHDSFNPHLSLAPQSNFRRTLANLRRYIRVSIDLLRWSINAGIRSNAWVDYQLLNQATNGISSDKFSRIITSFRNNSSAKGSWRSSSLFPWIKNADLPKIVETLDRDGIYIFDQVIDNNFLDAIQKYALSTTADLIAPHVTSKTRSVKLRGVFDPNRPLANGYFFDEGEMMNQPDFQQFCGDPLLLAIARDYLGVEPQLNEITSWWSAAFSRNPSSDMAQLFHNDLSHIKWLNIFIYITDVDKNSGPHTFVIGSHKPDKQGEELRSRGLVRIADEEIFKSFGKDRILDITGPRGTVFIADTRAYHKGQRPISNHRLVLQMILVNSLFPDIGKKKWDVVPKNPTLIETIKNHPRMFDRYNIK